MHAWILFYLTESKYKSVTTVQYRSNRQNAQIICKHPLIRVPKWEHIKNQYRMVWPIFSREGAESLCMIVFS